jgi:hypothetical protein
VEVKEISGDDRISEIARMLSGTITEVSLKHAKELLEKSSDTIKRSKGANRTARTSEKVSGLFS